MSPDPVVVTVDQTRCIGSGLCARTAPDALALGPNGRAVPVHPTAAPSHTLTEAAEMCPVEAIAVHHATTGELLAPIW
ncbi:ferredoxin [Kitasatospora griseola]|uniref:ferredoxin n=1 Tax=Kitasatospora griseola TaxID=2064 RepID=UPI00343807C7